MKSVCANCEHWGQLTTLPVGYGNCEAMYENNVIMCGRHEWDVGGRATGMIYTDTPFKATHRAFGCVFWQKASRK